MVLIVAVGIAALGLLTHNLLSLPLPLLAAENVGPLLVYVGLLAWLRLSGGASAARIALLLWTLLNLVVGGILSILPILPFASDQTLGHYVAHAIYALTQVPLLLLLIRPTRTLAAA